MYESSNYNCTNVGTSAAGCARGGLHDDFFARGETKPPFLGTFCF